VHRVPAATRRTALAGVLAAQLGVLAAVGAYLGTGGSWAPDGGLQQIDVLTLRERVPGVSALGGTPTLVVGAGDQRDERCRHQLELALDRRGGPIGLGPAYGLVVLLPPDSPSPAGAARRRPDTVVRVDVDGLLPRLALPADGCRPGYVVVAPDDTVRYRTLDPGWGEHAGEQSVLLDAT